MTWDILMFLICLHYLMRLSANFQVVFWTCFWSLSLFVFQSHKTFHAEDVTRTQHWLNPFSSIVRSLATPQGYIPGSHTFLKTYSILLQYLFHAKCVKFNAITYLHFFHNFNLETQCCRTKRSRPCCYFYKTVVIGKEQNLNKQMAACLLRQSH